ncbi:MAG: ABC transporter permease [Bacteroidales bacterium]|nr:ABC transporter permease [Bacteroidales bacterium]
MKFDYWFSRRMRLRRGAPSSTATGVVIAIAGVALALMVMELSLAIVTGFKNEIRAKVEGFEAAVSVLPPYDVLRGESAADFIYSDTLARVISAAVPACTPVASLHRQAILKTDNDFAAVECVARDSRHDPAFEKGNMTAGSWPGFDSEDDSDSIVISAPLARTLSLDCGDRIYLYFFINGEVKARRAFIAGLYQSNFSEFDISVVYTDLAMLQHLGPTETSPVTSVDLEGIATADIPAVTERLQDSLVAAYRAGQIAGLHPVTNVLTTGALYFNWLDLLDTNVAVIFILMACVAAFTLISSLFIIILDRVPTIGILRALGQSRGGVSHIFVIVAMRLVGTGMLIGNVCGLGLALLQRYTRLLPLDPEMYYLSYVPVEINWTAMIVLNIAVAAAAWLILILPARLAARIDPASTMRYE